ncbi:hypothetical protein MLD38_000990 [Melastoma candidum]|uniref:Uncharacterized protein n=1 Tax=Melastoma candidum TaxID=119954 RepID=A0ACB9SFS0_9MYRT|nr:hypothetical protein MLD38_000990 [Melastoma candidum]
MRRSITRLLQQSSRGSVSTAVSPPCKKKNKPTTTTTTTSTANSNPKSKRDSFILQRFKLRHLDGAATSPVNKSIILNVPPSTPDGRNPLCQPPPLASTVTGDSEVVSGFGELGLSEELVAACKEMGMVVPSEVMCEGIPEILKGRSLVVSSRPGFSRTLAYLLPLFQLLRRDAALFCVQQRHPRAIVLCRSAEQCDMVFETAKFINQHVRRKPAGKSVGTQVGGNKECSSNAAIGMLVGTPEEILRQIDDGDVVVTDVRYLVVDEADVLLHSPCFAAIPKRLTQLKTINESSEWKFQTILVTSPISKVLEKHLVEPLEWDQSGEVTAVILEIGQDEVIQLMETPSALKTKLSEALDSFSTSTSGS